VEGAQRNAEDQAQLNVATGLLMVSQACTSEQARGLLREAATHDERTILEIARRIIEQHNSSR
jgi:AmiR/NasT family two-component response regulator